MWERFPVAVHTRQLCPKMGELCGPLEEETMVGKTNGFGSNSCLIPSASQFQYLMQFGSGFYSSFGSCSRKGFLRNLNTISEVHLQDYRIKKKYFQQGRSFTVQKDEQFWKKCCADDFQISSLMIRQQLIMSYKLLHLNCLGFVFQFQNRL